MSSEPVDLDVQNYNKLVDVASTMAVSMETSRLSHPGANQDIRCCVDSGQQIPVVT
jgi:hypothetical protein